jgi:GNAT superfamily N-acetyltransferase
MRLVRYADRPDLRAIRFETLVRHTFPEYMNHNEPGGRYWGRLYNEYPDFQLGLVDGDELVAELHSVPTPWDGSAEDLPSGWDEAFTRAFESDREADVLCALAISVRPDQQGRQLSSRMLDGMRRAAVEHGLRELIAPVRPTKKAEYPLVPIERYVEWRREDGSHFDPWIRLHKRVGGTILAAAPQSMVIEAPAAEWEEWCGMRFPQDGDYVVPGMLAPLVVSGGVGRHVEPNVWLRHPPLTDL